MKKLTVFWKNLSIFWKVSIISALAIVSIYVSTKDWNDKKMINEFCNCDTKKGAEYEACLDELCRKFELSKYSVEELEDLMDNHVINYEKECTVNTGFDGHIKWGTGIHTYAAACRFRNHCK